MRVTYSQLRRLVAEQVKNDPDYQAIKAKRERQSRSKRLRRSIMGAELSALANGVTEAVMPVVLSSLDASVLKEGVDLRALVHKLRKQIYEKVLATISDVESAKKGRYPRNADERGV